MKHLLVIEIESCGGIVTSSVAAMVDRLVNSGLMDAAATVKECDGDLAQAEAALDLNISSPQPLLGTRVMQLLVEMDDSLRRIRDGGLEGTEPALGDLLEKVSTFRQEIESSAIGPDSATTSQPATDGEFIDVAIAAIPLVGEHDLDPEDRGVAGVYSVQVWGTLPDDASMAAAALDQFHLEVGVGVLDDFEFWPFDPRTGKVLEQSEEHENYAMATWARDCRRVADKLPRIFQVAVEAVGDDQAVCLVGTVHVAADELPQAQRRAFDLLWDPRLDAASCSASFRSQCVSTAA